MKRSKITFFLTIVLGITLHSCLDMEPQDQLGGKNMWTSTESYLDYTAYRQRKVSAENMKNVSNAVCCASVSTAHDIGADYIIVPSITGFTSGGRHC